MTYTITLKDENGNVISRNYHEAAIIDAEYIGEQLQSMKDTLENKEVEF